MGYGQGVSYYSKKKNKGSVVVTYIHIYIKITAESIAMFVCTVSRMTNAVFANKSKK